MTARRGLEVPGASAEQTEWSHLVSLLRLGLSPGWGLSAELGPGWEGIITEENGHWVLSLRAPRSAGERANEGMVRDGLSRSQTSGGSGRAWGVASRSQGQMAPYGSLLFLHSPPFEALRRICR